MSEEKAKEDYIVGFIDGKLAGVNHIVRLLDKVFTFSTSDMESVIEIKALIRKIKEVE